jgi:hypothetical protein
MKAAISLCSDYFAAAAAALPSGVAAAALAAAAAARAASATATRAAAASAILFTLSAAAFAFLCSFATQSGVLQSESDARDSLVDHLFLFTGRRLQSPRVKLILGARASHVTRHERHVHVKVSFFDPQRFARFFYDAAVALPSVRLFLFPFLLLPAATVKSPMFSGLEARGPTTGGAAVCAPAAHAQLCGIACPRLPRAPDPRRVTRIGARLAPGARRNAAPPPRGRLETKACGEASGSITVRVRKTPVMVWYTS